MSTKTIIFMPLADEGTDVWRPVDAVAQDDDYRVLGPMPAGEVWQFAPGTVVRCQEKVFGDGRRGLAAVEVANPDTT